MARAATMDFFSHQAAARTRTSMLVFMYAIAVVLIVAAVYAAYVGILVAYGAQQGRPAASAEYWFPDAFLGVSLVVLSIVALGTLWKTAQLRGGGRAVAESLGGRLVVPQTEDAAERRLINVVEEMSIASGLPVPPVYVMDGESSINAFAAGFTPSDAVIGVTRGCMVQLTRAELQGVIAHEFSHVFNGDMRLNIRLMGVLHGILALAVIGYWTMRLAGPGSRVRSSNRKGGGGAAAVAIFGFVVMLVGYIGVFFGKLIKSAVSRQREFLADASAVQFTRQPEGLGGALKKIGGLAHGSRLAAPNAEEASHLFFANGLSASFMSLFSTHPPLAERVRRIEPSFAGEFAAYASAHPSELVEPRAPVPTARPLAAAMRAGASARFAIDPAAVASSVGRPGPEHLAFAAGMIASFPPALRAAVSDPFGARAAIYALLLDERPDVRAKQIHILEALADPAARAEALKLADAAAALSPAARLPLASLAMPALKAMSSAQHRAFSECVTALIGADNRVDLHEFALGRMIERHALAAYGQPRQAGVKYHALQALADPVGVLLSALAHLGSPQADQAAAAYARGMAAAGIGRVPPVVDAAHASVNEVGRALSVLEDASPAIKRRLLAGCIAAVDADGTVTVGEAELLRAVADSLDVPVPPFIAPQTAPHAV
jgi:Zn-dependent protease with chaperone function